MPLLRLKAQDAEDLAALAAVCQDALAPVHDLAFLPQEHRFVVALNRFRWELDGGPDGVFERVNCGLCFEQVTRVETRGLDLKQREFILDLLTITEADRVITLSFAGGRDVRLTVSRIDCRLDDFGEPWPTRSQPHHDQPEPWREWEGDPLGQI